MSSPKRSPGKPATSSSSEHTALSNDGGMGEGASGSLPAIGEELRRAARDKSQRPDRDGGSLVTDGNLSATAAPPRQPWGLMPGMDSLQHCSNPYGRPFASSPLDSAWSGGPFGPDFIPEATAVQRPHLALAAHPPRLPTTTSTSDRDRCASLGPQYLTIRKSANVYQTQDWKDMSLALYLPLEHDIIINTHTVDQLSYESNYFFLADSWGNYRESQNGHAIHFWQHSLYTKKLYVAQSIVFLKEQDYNYVMELVKRL